MPQSREKPNSSDLPLWLGLALALVLASLALGTWLLFGENSKPKSVTQNAIPLGPATADAPTQPATLIVPPPKVWLDPAAANWDKNFFNLTSPDAFHKTSDNSWSIKGGRLFMQVHRDKTSKLVVRFVYPFEEFLPKDTLAMLRTRWTTWETHKLIDDLKITLEQWEKLQAVDPDTDTQISRADRQTMMDLFDEALTAFNQNKTINGGLPTVPEEKLTDALHDLDQKYYQPTLDRVTATANQVKSIFTDLQYTGLMRRYSTW
jgi:hypothetical protein